MQIKELLNWGYESLTSTSNSARLDAEVLLAHDLKKPVTFLLSHNNKKVSLNTLRRYKVLIERRKKGEPVAYLTGKKEFFFLDFTVDQNVLVPRPDTEILVECLIKYLNKLKTSIFDFRFSKFILLDIGTGSGCIPISVLKNVDGLSAIATDISKEALDITKKNIKKHNLTSRIQLIQSDLLINVPYDLLKDKKVIMSANLPYIPTELKVGQDLKYEPPISLYGGEDGADVYRKLLDQIRSIRPIAMFFELFESQIPEIERKIPDYRIKHIEDMSGEARVLVMEKMSSS